MLAKIYLFTWLFFFAVFMLTFVTGSLSLIAWTTFGFIAFGLVFMGMIGVLPVTAAHPVTKEARPATVKDKPQANLEISRAAHSVRV
jgi:hypothetical protein